MKKTLVNILETYKKVVSPALEGLFGKACRFTPTCSEYTIEAVEKKGILIGSYLGLKRFIRCNPLSKPRYDPVA